jgi:addiction module HigA family antidote
MNLARMFNPPHPGLTLREDVLPAIGVTVSEAAKQLGMSRVALSRVLNGHASISAELALRLESWLGVDRGGDAAVWLAEQAAYDLWHAEQAMTQRPTPVYGFPEVIACAKADVIETTVVHMHVAQNQAERFIAAAQMSSARTVAGTHASSSIDVRARSTAEGN